VWVFSESLNKSSHCRLGVTRWPITCLVVSESVWWYKTPENMVTQQNMRTAAQVLGDWAPENGHHGAVHVPVHAPRHQ
jgi:hypothetical protein